MNRPLVRFFPALAVVVLIAVAVSLRGKEKPDPKPKPEDDGLHEPKDDPPPLKEAPSILSDRSADVDERIEALDSWFPEDAPPRELPFPLLTKIVMDGTEDAGLRMAVLLALGRSGDRRALRPLLDFHRSFPDFSARHVLVKALGDLGFPEARAVVVESLRNEASVSARAHAARALERPGPSERERAVMRDSVLGDSSENVRLAALGVLIRSGGENAFLRTLEGLETTPPAIRTLARKALQDE